MNCFWQMKICSAKKSNAPPNLIQYIKTFSKYHMKVFVKCKITIHFLQGIFDKKKFQMLFEQNIASNVTRNVL